jgi:hypothetical protein
MTTISAQIVTHYDRTSVEAAATASGRGLYDRATRLGNLESFFFTSARLLCNASLRFRSAVVTVERHCAPVCETGVENEVLNDGKKSL